MRPSLHAAPHTGGRLGLRLRNRPEHLHHQCNVDGLHREIAKNGIGICVECSHPPVRVLRVGSARPRGRVAAALLALGLAACAMQAPQTPPDVDLLIRGGTIYDGDSGKTYNCTLWFENGDTAQLSARGYVGISLFGRTEVFTRVTDKDEKSE